MGVPKFWKERKNKWKFLHFFSITIPASTILVFWSYLRYRNTDIKKVMIFTWKENVDHNIIFYKLTKAEVYSRHPDMTTLWLAMEDYPGSRWTSPFLLISSLPPLVHATLVKIAIIINFVISAMHGGQGVRGCTGVPLLVLQTDSENRLSVPSLMPLIVFQCPFISSLY